MSDEPEILFENRGAVGLITLNRPKALNALTHGMAVAMHAQLKAWEKDDAVACVIIQGMGERAFCAGGDIRTLYESGRAGTPYALEFYRDEYLLNAYIKHYPKSYIALIRGIVMGGGVGVSVHGSHRIADETTLFAMPETGIGLFPDVGGSFFLPRLPGELGMYLGLTGARLKPTDVYYCGIATDYVPAKLHGAFIDAVARGEVPGNVLSELGQKPGPYLLEQMKNAIPHDQLKAGHLVTSDFEPRYDPSELEARRDKIDACFGGRSVEDILARLDADSSDWAMDIAKTIRTKSPTASKLAFRQIREGAKLDFDDCMRMEFRMVNRVIAGHDFYEGVRATIIDKDGAPKWQPATFAEVSDADINAYFHPIDPELPL